MKIGADEVLVIALVRNGAYYLDAFFDYYRNLGARHFAFFDNGSTDDTVARIMAEPDTVIDQSNLPLGDYEDLMRAYPAQAYGRNRWCLYVDMDEQLDFEGATHVGLSGLVRYLSGESFTAMPAQMVEMFPQSGLGAVANLRFKAALEQFRYYDLSAVRWVDYHSSDIPFAALMAHNRLVDPALQFAFGGVRGRVFGENCCLTKHPLVFNGPDVRIAPHPHVSSGVRVGDVTAAIRHYKFTNNPAQRDLAETASGVLQHGENAARAEKMQGADVTLYSPAAPEWQGIEPLYQAGFLRRAPRYSAWLEQQK